MVTIQKKIYKQRKTRPNMPGFRKKEGKKGQAFKNRDSRFLKYAFISGILLVILFSLSVILNIIFSENTEILQLISILQNVFTIVFVFYFFYGFFILGKKYDRFLKIISVLLLFLLLGYYVLSIFSPYFFSKNLMLKLDEKAESIGFDSATEFFDYLNANPTESQKYSEFIVQEMIPLILPMLILIFSYLLIAFTLFILFGVGLIKIGKEIKYARVAGILGIVGICTALLLIGIFLLLISYVFMIIILFKESKVK